MNTTNTTNTMQYMQYMLHEGQSPSYLQYMQHKRQFTQEIAACCYNDDILRAMAAADDEWMRGEGANSTDLLFLVDAEGMAYKQVLASSLAQRAYLASSATPVRQQALCEVHVFPRVHWKKYFPHSFYVSARYARAFTKMCYNADILNTIMVYAACDAAIEVLAYSDAWFEADGALQVLLGR